MHHGKRRDDGHTELSTGQRCGTTSSKSISGHHCRVKSSQAIFFFLLLLPLLPKKKIGQTSARSSLIILLAVVLRCCTLFALSAPPLYLFFSFFFSSSATVTHRAYLYYFFFAGCDSDNNSRFFFFLVKTISHIDGSFIRLNCMLQVEVSVGCTAAARDTSGEKLRLVRFVSRDRKVRVTSFSSAT